MYRRKKTHFKQTPDMPPRVTARLERRVRFSESDALGIVWHGRYPIYFEEGFANLINTYGFSIKDFYGNGFNAPIVQFHIDCFYPLMLDELFTISGSLVWTEGAKIHTEYALIKTDESIAATGYTVQMFTDIKTGQALISPPAPIVELRRRWAAGEFTCQD